MRDITLHSVAGRPEVVSHRMRRLGPRPRPGTPTCKVAALAEMSVEYYAKLERGALVGVSAGVLEGIARALRLDEPNAPT